MKIFFNQIKTNKILFSPIISFQLEVDNFSPNLRYSYTLIVQDIYGGNYDFLNLPKSLIASSFGKCVRSPHDIETYNKVHFSQKDMAKSLLRMISYNIGQLAVLYAQLHKLNRIYFGGYFIRGNFMPVLTISEAVAFFSKGTIPALFFKHDGFLGALGAFNNGIIRDQENDKNLRSSHPEDFTPGKGYFEENIATSSFANYSVTNHDHPIKIFSLDYDCERTMVFPLLKSGGQIMLDRETILQLVTYIEKWVPFFIQEFKNQHKLDEDKSEKMCDNFSKLINIRLNCYKSSDSLKILNYMNDILNIQTHFIKQFLVLDPFLNFKHTENLKAINDYTKFLIILNNTPDIFKRHSIILQNLFAGNLVDFSSIDVLLLKKSKLTHTNCLEKIKKSKQYYIGGTLEKWVEKFQQKIWKKVLFFLDNSGYDTVFGIFSFVREFLSIGAHVILAANTYPSFNNVVSSELSLIINRLRHICPIIKYISYIYYYSEGCDKRISIVQTGFDSPFLNLQSAHPDLCEIASDVDLIIIDGHSRSLLGFFDAKFSCDVMYAGTVTSQVFAKKWNFNIFDTFIKFDFYA
ncbi:hypothetical protein HZS_3233 [Henneguya salminicola]|nr:hypothetical protein HZS_3233 [Henneguya salminicola]